MIDVRSKILLSVCESCLDTIRADSKQNDMASATPSVDDDFVEEKKKRRSVKGRQLMRWNRKLD